MIKIQDIEYIREDLAEIFPDAIRGSVAKSRWGSGKRELHLAYFIYSDTVGGYKVDAHHGMYRFISWDTNQGIEWMYCHHDRHEFTAWVYEQFKCRKYQVERTVQM